MELVSLYVHQNKKESMELVSLGAGTLSGVFSLEPSTVLNRDGIPLTCDLLFDLVYDVLECFVEVILPWYDDDDLPLAKDHDGDSRIVIHRELGTNSGVVVWIINVEDVLLIQNTYHTSEIDLPR